MSKTYNKGSERLEPKAWKKFLKLTLKRYGVEFLTSQKVIKPSLTREPHVHIWKNKVLQESYYMSRAST
jgi:hypothetical protein